ncbi:MAG: hypothetical protein JXQ73_31660 [Phycisphaerae bacterium]|nr:hypothetical protein [Phycisphaerae bacterium]
MPPRRRSRRAALLTLGSVIAFSAIGCLSPKRPRTALASETASRPATPCPFAGHNCYSDFDVRASRRRLKTALDADLRYIEVDVNHHPPAGGFVVTHKSKNPPAEPRLDDFLEPLWRKWRGQPGEHVLIIDLKAGRSDAVARDMHRYLQNHRDVLSAYAPDGTRRTAGTVCVCLTGSSHLGQAYVDLAAETGELLALRDTGPRGRGKKAMRELLGRPRRPGVGYLTLSWPVVLSGTDASDDPTDWLREIVAGARNRGYKLRVYTLNARKPSGGGLASGKWDANWRACVRTGVDMIATDDYALATEWWHKIGVNWAGNSPPTPSSTRPAKSSHKSVVIERNGAAVR